MKLLLEGLELTAEGDSLEALGCHDGCVLHVEEGPADAVSDFDMPVACRGCGVLSWPRWTCPRWAQQPWSTTWRRPT